MSIDKIQEIEKVIRNNASALICPKCGGGGTGAYKGEGQKRCQECNGEGLVDWNYGDAPEKISDLISQAEARGREESKNKLIEDIATKMAFESGLGVSEWESFIEIAKEKIDLLTKLKEDK